MAVNTVQAVINGQTYNLTYNSTSGKWEGTITAPSSTSYSQSGGYYNVAVTATDTAGNSKTVDSTDATLGANCKLIVKETGVPTIAITSPGASAKLTNNKPTVTFQLRDSGAGIKISTLALKIDGGTAIGNTATGMTCTSVSGGYDCTYVVQTALGEGSHTILIDVSDNDGNSATDTSVTFTVDTVTPSLNVTAPANASITNNPTCTVTGTTSDTTSNPCVVTIKLNNVDQGTVTLSSGSFSKTITLASGLNTIIVRSTDGSGLYTEITRTITLDTVAPTITAIELVPNPVNTGATMVIKVTVSDS